MRVALLGHRGNPYVGGQGVYLRHLSRELVREGHRVHLFCGPPWPYADDGVDLVPVRGLDLYRTGDPDPMTALRRVRGPVDALEWATLMAGVYPEALAFSLRALTRLRRSHPFPYDVVHDNADVGYGLLGLLGKAPVVATIHHPATIDREFDVAAERGFHRQLLMRHWYGFTRMQGRVARRLIGLTTVSEAARSAIVDAFRVPAERIRVIELGVDERVFTPPATPRVPGRIVTVASSSAPLKGMSDLFEAVSRLRAEPTGAGPPRVELIAADTPGVELIAAEPRRVELIVVGRPRPSPAGVRFVTGLDDAELAALVGSAEVAVVPSRYEGFSLPAVEAMATGTALVVTAAGAIPEVVGDAALHVPPGDPPALAAAIRRLLDDPPSRRRLGEAGRARVLRRYTWRRTARRTAEWYSEMGAIWAASRRRE
ncbi:glycosyltransferase family 4 protein [Actinoplanes sp. HUAS TT8]|uniref:glycosyltransferase family 4 protein n=1 Tax=Actinoplanes sp. HUAS TT8 TaxID=3447453 RepID=UPI003F522C38